MRRRFPLLMGVGLVAIWLQAQTPIAWEMLDPSCPGLGPVAKAVAQGDGDTAEAALLTHFRARPDIVDAWTKAKKRTPPAFERKVADAALEHRFYVHDSQPEWLFYGNDIDWTFWPVKANELRWQLHRHKWFMPLLRVWAATGDTRYFSAWKEQWADWRRKNPWPITSKSERENARFAWRPLEVSHRLDDLPRQLALAVHAPAFTAADLRVFLADVIRHGNEVWARRSAKGNHLLFEMQRLLAAAQAFPELNVSAQWRTNAVRVLREELRKQVYPDGVQYELDLGYHLSSYALFRSAAEMAPTAFTEEDRAKIGRMAAFADDLFFPDGGHPYFADTHTLGPKRRRLTEEAKALFPKAFDRPAFASRAYPHGGFYVLREGTPETGSMVVLKAGPPAFWHNQPDNGTFSYWHRGRDFFPDAGSYVYGGPDTDAARATFRATKVHSTLTLDDKDIAPGSRCAHWEVREGGETTVTVSTPVYPGLVHQRSMCLRPGGVLEVEDQLSGAPEGCVRIRFCLAPGANPIRHPDGSWRTRFPDGNNIRLRPSDADWTAELEHGWHSRTSGQKEARPILRFEKRTSGAHPLKLTTIIEPISDKTEETP